MLYSCNLLPCSICFRITQSPLFNLTSNLLKIFISQLAITCVCVHSEFIYARIFTLEFSGDFIDFVCLPMIYDSLFCVGGNLIIFYVFLLYLAQVIHKVFYSLLKSCASHLYCLWRMTRFVMDSILCHAYVYSYLTERLLWLFTDIRMLWTLGDIEYDCNVCYVCVGFVLFFFFFSISIYFYNNLLLFEGIALKLQKHFYIINN